MRAAPLVGGMLQIPIDSIDKTKGDSGIARYRAVGLSRRCGNHVRRYGQGFDGLGFRLGNLADAMAFQAGASLDFQAFMGHVALDAGRAGNGHHRGIDLANQFAVHFDVAGTDLTRNARTFANHQRGADDVTVHFAIHLDLALGNDVADDADVGCDHRQHGTMLIV